MTNTEKKAVKAATRIENEIDKEYGRASIFKTSVEVFGASSAIEKKNIAISVMKAAKELGFKETRIKISKYFIHSKNWRMRMNEVKILGGKSRELLNSLTDAEIEKIFLFDRMGRTEFRRKDREIQSYYQGKVGYNPTGWTTVSKRELEYLIKVAVKTVA